MSAPQHCQQQNNVSFNDDAVHCIPSLHVNDYTDEEVFQCWYTPNDYKEIKREVNLTILMMDKQSNFDEGVNFSSRGLEHKTSDQMVPQMEHKFFAIDAVLEEQDRQVDEGVCDPEALCLAYAEYSFASHMSAFLMGASDEKTAIELHNATSKAASTPGNRATCGSHVFKKQDSMATPSKSCCISSQGLTLTNLICPLPSSSPQEEREQANFGNILSVLDEVEQTLAVDEAC